MGLDDETFHLHLYLNMSIASCILLFQVNAHDSQDLAIFILFFFATGLLTIHVVHDTLCPTLCNS